jgi:hypothetical protein
MVRTGGYGSPFTPVGVAFPLLLIALAACCAAPAMTNDKYNTENGKWNQIKSSRAISNSCAIPGCPWRLAALMPCW